MSFLKRLLGGGRKKRSLEKQVNQLNQQALHLYQQGQYDQALILAQQVMEIWRTALGEEHPDFADSLNNLGALYHSIGDYAQAEPLYRQGMEIRRTALGEEHPDFADSLNNLATLYHSIGDYAQAEPLYRQEMEIGHTALGEEHPSFATSLSGLAVLYHLMGDYAQAEPLLRQALEIRRTALVADGYHARVDGLTSLAVLFGAVGVWLGYPLADPIVGLLITIAILRIVWDSSKSVFTRLLDGVDPQVVDEIRHTAQHTPGVQEVTEVRMRWLGHRQHAELNVTVDSELTVEAGHEVANEMRHELLHHLRYLSGATIHIDPANASGPEYHRIQEHEHDDLPAHSH